MQYALPLCNKLYLFKKSLSKPAFCLLSKDPLRPPGLDLKIQVTVSQDLTYTEENRVTSGLGLTPVSNVTDPDPNNLDVNKI